ncbi:uncharacterized protein LOC105703594 [Orussus abietinus]|uniref:uncharacterized protein LOC105703594 n=1 Tax=Orussus abietinus TaxID=222816 RepID=UPI0006251E72|nr:uncharacterized protein LOC105703594 [Orussus abietinus]
MLGKNVENVENERNWKGDWDTKMAADEELLEEGRKKDKGGGGKLIFLMAAASKATLMYFGLHVLAAIAGKALVVAKVALAIATAIVLKKALAHEEKTSYEIIKHPHHSFIQTHSSSVDYDHHDHGFEESGHRRRRRRTRR